MYTVSELIKSTGVTRKALRGYDEMGLLCPTRKPNSKGQQWEYDDDAVVILQIIIIFSEGGYKRQEIKEVIDGIKQGKDMTESLADLVKRLKDKQNRIEGMCRYIELFINQFGGENEERIEAINKIDFESLNKSFGGYKKLFDTVVDYLSGKDKRNEKITRFGMTFMNQLIDLVNMSSLPPDSDRVQEWLTDELHKMVLELSDALFENEDVLPEEVKYYYCFFLFCALCFGIEDESDFVPVAKKILSKETIEFLEEVVECHYERCKYIEEKYQLEKYGDVFS